LKLNENISVNNLDLWVINQKVAVCEIQINFNHYFDGEKIKENNALYRKIKEKISFILKEHKIHDFFIDII